MVYDPPLQVNINENPILEYLINGDAQEADFTITYTAKDGEHSWTALANPELGHINTKGDPDNGVPAVTDGHADAGTPLGGFDADCNVSEKMGTVVSVPIWRNGIAFRRMGSLPFPRCPIRPWATM